MFVIPLRDNAELRALEPWHAEEFRAHLDRARTHIAPWVGAGFVASDLAGARAVLQRYADEGAADRRRIYGIWRDGTLVGGTMFVSLDAAAGVCELGCWLEPAAEGRGLITPVIRMMVDWAFARGLTRAEWRTVPENARSINVARRLGMSLDGTLRQYFTGADGVRHDKQIWSVLASEWPGAPAAPDTEARPAGPDAAARPAASEAAARPADPDAGVKAELDRLTRTFLGAFTNTGGTLPNVDAIRDVFIPEGRIISNVGAEPVLYDLDGFIAPRRKILTDGTLTEFSEWEVAERTEIFGGVAHRFSEYHKTGFLRGAWFEGAGRKTTQFVRTPAGWRMSSMAWDDA